MMQKQAEKFSNERYRQRKWREMEKYKVKDGPKVRGTKGTKLVRKQR